MTNPPVTCPFCNSLVTATPGMSGGQRLPCPRCGESFALLTSEAPASTDISQQPSTLPKLETEPRLQGQPWIINKPFKANRRTAFILLGVMGFMAATGLAYALCTEHFRRENDKGIVKTNPKRRPPLDTVDSLDNTPTAPAKLEALGWLPPDTTIVVGVHVRELLATKTGNTLLTQPFQVGGQTVRVDTLATWTGFKLDEIDHLVLGVQGDKLVPVPILIVRARQDDREVTVRNRLAARRAEKAGNRTVYEFEPANAPALFSKLHVCWVDDRTAVYALSPRHLHGVPDNRTTDLRQLPAEVRDVLTERVRAGGPLWIAGHSDDWNKTTLFKLLFNSLKEKDRVCLSKVSTFAAWVQQPEEPVVIEAVFDCGSDEAAKDLQKYLNVPNQDWNAAQEGGWLTVQSHLSVQKLRELLPH